MFSKFRKLKDSLSRTRDALFGKISQIVVSRKIDDDLIDAIEESLLKADIGVAAADRIIGRLRQLAAEQKAADSDAVFWILKNEIRSILNSRPIKTLEQSVTPIVWLITGINGAGKTTTVGKLAFYFKNAGKSVMIAACDTFRAAAVEQLEIWARRSGVAFLKAQSGADPASVAYDAAVSAKAKGVDYLIIDTAGRLHTKLNLMEELKKIRRVTEKVIPPAQIHSALIIDGSTGQNALSQVKIFTEAVGCDGLIVTKLDGTARGGIVVAIAQELSVPVDFIGVGEGVEDLQPFDAEGYVEALFED
jgi:fused signal recognition particle receptor